MPWEATVVRVLANQLSVSQLVGSIAVEEVLLMLKIGFLVLLYLFIWRVVRTASRDLRTPQESFVLAPQRSPAEPARRRRRPAAGRLVVVRSPALPDGDERLFDSVPVTVGRDTANDVSLAEDAYASGLHARFDPRPDGVWVLDVGSTNGTYVNGERLAEPRKLEPGDVIRIGESDFRFER